MDLANDICTNGREDYQVSSDWFRRVSEHLDKQFRKPEFVYERYHVCMLATNVNQYLVFQPPQWTWWVYEWGAQVRKYKISKSPHSKKSLLSKKTYNHAITYNNILERYSYFILDYFTILERPSRPTTKTLLNQQDPDRLLFIFECNYD
jgi:hypothetical protein